jgi:hypothetical protein
LRAAGAVLADYSSAGLGTVADLAERAGLARHRVMRFAQGLGYDGFTAVPSALREELTQRSKGPLGRVRWDIGHGSDSELLLPRARQVSDLALEHRICVAASCSRPGWAGSPASTPISPDIDEQIEARLTPFMWKAILDTRVLIAEDLGAAPTPLVLAQVEC